jgi:predicted PurR-regulated permease PerM
MPRTLTINVSVRSIVTAIALLLALWVASLIPDVLIMVLVALIVTSAMLPAVEALQRHYRWPRIGAILAVFGVMLGVLVLVVLIIVPAVIDQARTLITGLPAYSAKVIQTYNWLQRLDARFNVLPDLNQMTTAFSSYATTWLTSTLGLATRVLEAVFEIVVILIITFFLLLEGPELKRGLLALVPPQHRMVAAEQFEPVGLKLGGYVQGLLLSIGFLMVYLAVSLTVAGVPLSLVLALIAGILEFIPTLGSLLGSIPAILVALTVSWQKALIVVGIYLVGNFIQGNFVAPFVYSRSVEVSPVLVILALLIGGKLMGIPGALIAVPVTAALMVLVQNLYIEPMERGSSLLAQPSQPIAEPSVEHGVSPSPEEPEG